MLDIKRGRVKGLLDTLGAESLDAIEKHVMQEIKRTAAAAFSAPGYFTGEALTGMEDAGNARNLRGPYRSADKAYRSITEDDDD
jgi:hypothetical protein